MEKYEILILENHMGDAKKTAEQLNNYVPSGKKPKMEFLWLNGEIPEPYEGQGYLFYNGGIIKTIEKKIHNNMGEGKKTGILLGLYLTRDSLESTIDSYYPCPELAKRIFFRFYREIPVYVLAASPNFAVQSERVMGIGLSAQHLSKYALYHGGQDSIEKLYAFYHKSWER